MSDSDAVIERVGRATLDVVHELERLPPQERYAAPWWKPMGARALAALEAGDSLDGGLYVRHEPWVSAGLENFPQMLGDARTEDIARKAWTAAAEAAREACWGAVMGMPGDPTREEFAAAIRKLKLPA